MKVIKGPIALERIGHWGRVVRYEPDLVTRAKIALRIRGPFNRIYEVQCSPYPPRGHAVLLGRDDNWVCFGGTVGYGMATFVREADAVEFMEDIPKLDDRQMKIKWEKRTGPLPLWDEVV